VDASVSATAAIAQSKIANLTNDLLNRAPVASPTFTGTVVAPTPVSTSNNTVAANTLWVQDKLSTKADLTNPTVLNSLRVSDSDINPYGEISWNPTNMRVRTSDGRAI
jgi:hypothetical protein